MVARRQFLDAQSLAFGAFGCLLALAVGAAAGTGHGVPVAGALFGLAVCAAGIAIYVRDPVRALTWLWILLVLNAPLTTLVGHDTPTGVRVRNSDEVLVLLLLALTAWRTMRTDTQIPSWFILPVIVAACGLLGAALHHAPFGVTLTGAWLGLKLWVMIGIALLLPWKPDDVTRVYKVITRVGVLVAGYGFVDYLTGGALSGALQLEGFDVGVGDPSRANAVHSIFYHPGEYSLFMSVLFAFTFARYAGMRRKADLWLALLFAVSVLLTLRVKGFLSLAVVVVIVALAQQTIRNRRGMTAVLIGSLLVVGAYSVQSNVIARQVSIYTSSETNARAQIYLTGEHIAADNFPLGAGFGRFASYGSRLHYSPVYDEYGLSSVYGLSRQYPHFIDDTSWPSVIGETGYAGLVAYVVGLILLTAAILHRLRSVQVAVRWVPLAALCTLAVIVTDSLASPALFHWATATSFALILGPALVGARPAVEDRPKSRTA